MWLANPGFPFPRIAFSHAGSPSVPVDYQVQASTDLVDWETIEVSYSGFDSASRRTAHVDCSGLDRLYLRLSVSE